LAEYLTLLLQRLRRGEISPIAEAAVPPPCGYFRIVAAGSTITTQVLWLFGKKFNQAIGSDEKKVGNWEFGIEGSGREIYWVLDSLKFRGREKGERE
jgi:hypothetical protein